ncbi:hypothetical protein [Cedecea sp.]|uniref:hypothetical protein n=1 Tax=Cedecea sp. TaxID=1970739 RepID=UPI002F410725
MNGIISLTLLLPCTFFISSCVSNDSARMPPVQAYPADNFFTANNQVAPQESDATFIRGLTEGMTVASTNNKCIDNFNLLKEEKSGQFEKYSEEYTKITDGYAFLNANKNIMDDSAKRIYIMELKMKIETLCAKIQYSSFILVNEKRKSFSDI